MHNISQVSPSNLPFSLKGIFSNFPNRYVFVALAALALVAVAFVALRNYAPNALNNCFSRSQPNPTSTLTFSGSSVPTLGSSSRHPVGGIISEASIEADSEQVALSAALLADVKDNSLLRTAAGVSALINQALAFNAVVQQESKLDARVCTAKVPTIESVAPEDGNWQSLTVQVMHAWSTQSKQVTIEEESGNAGGYPVQFASCVGPRSSMEDEHIAATLTHPDVVGNIGLVGVFDGHGGSAASKFVKAKIAQYLEAEFAANAETRAIQSKESIYASCILALHNAFIKIDEAFSREMHPNYNFHFNDGTTVTVALIVDSKVIVANLGDGRAILVRNGVPMPMSVDAEPEHSRYAKQVRALGGYVHEFRDFVKVTYRVQGCSEINHHADALATPAALGDHNIVPFQNSIAGRKCVINVPEITMYDYLPGDQIVMACDGLWDALSINHVVERTREREERHVQVSDAALLTRLAIKTPGQNDNVTVAIVDLTPQPVDDSQNHV